jgi:hypothetical protein
MRRRLGQMELAHTLSGEYAPYNAVAALRLAGAPDPVALERSLGVLRKRHPFLSASIVSERGRYFIDTECAAEIRVRVVERLDESRWTSLVEDELNRRYDAGAGPMLHCTYVAPSRDDDRGEIILTLNHTIIDAASGANLCHELLCLCDALGRGREPRGYEPLSPLPPVETAFPAAFKGLSGSGRLLRFLLRQLAGEAAHLVHAGGARRIRSTGSFRCRILPVQLSREASASVIQRARQQRVTVNGALQAAMLLAVARHLYDGRTVALRHMIFPGLRAYIQPPISDESLGCYLSLIFMATRVGSERGFWALARVIDEKTYAAAKRGEKFLAVRASAWAMRTMIRWRRGRMAATALNYAGSTRLASEYGTTRLLAVHGFVSNFPMGPEYTAQARLFAGRLWWDVVYLDSDMSREVALDIADDMFSTLEEQCR